jgi:hypothetical protein
MKKVLITNNPLVNEKYSKDLQIEYYEISYIEILKKVRDRVHKGSKVLNHPLSGSLKPNETPYKTIMILDGLGQTDLESVLLIENSIATAEKFLKDKNTPQWNEKILKDFQIIDLSLVESSIKVS